MLFLGPHVKFNKNFQFISKISFVEDHNEHLS